MFTAAYAPDGTCVAVAARRTLAAGRGRILLVEDLVTGPDHRSTGIGARLLDSLVERARAARAPPSSWTRASPTTPPTASTTRAGCVSRRTTSGWTAWTDRAAGVPARLAPSPAPPSPGERGGRGDACRAPARPGRRPARPPVHEARRARGSAAESTHTACAAEASVVCRCQPP
ncbi:hypothetical protein SFUMM280S_03147 [Streptomyces fumanus]